MRRTVWLAKSDENLEMRTCAPTYMSGRTVRKKCAGGANLIPYSSKFVTRVR